MFSYTSVVIYDAITHVSMLVHKTGVVLRDGLNSFAYGSILCDVENLMNRATRFECLIVASPLPRVKLASLHPFQPSEKQVQVPYMTPCPREVGDV